MVLELKVPHGAMLGVLQPLAPILLSYVLRFVYVGIYGNKPYESAIIFRSTQGPRQCRQSCELCVGLPGANCAKLYHFGLTAVGKAPKECGASANHI